MDNELTRLQDLIRAVKGWDVSDVLEQLGVEANMLYIEDYEAMPTQMDVQPHPPQQSSETPD